MGSFLFWFGSSIGVNLKTQVTFEIKVTIHQIKINSEV